MTKQSNKMTAETMRNFHLYTLYAQQNEKANVYLFKQGKDGRGDLVTRFIGHPTNCVTVLNTMETDQQVVFKMTKTEYSFEQEKPTLDDYAEHMPYYYHKGTFLEFLNSFNLWYREEYPDFDVYEDTFVEAIHRIYLQFIELTNNRPSEIEVSAEFGYTHENQLPDNFGVTIKAPFGNDERRIIISLPTTRDGFCQVKMLNISQEPNGELVEILFLKRVTMSKLGNLSQLLSRIMVMEKYMNKKSNENSGEHENV